MTRNNDGLTLKPSKAPVREALPATSLCDHAVLPTSSRGFITFKHLKSIESFLLVHPAHRLVAMIQRGDEKLSFPGWHAYRETATGTERQGAYFSLVSSFSLFFRSGMFGA